jgi:peptide chain release factor subunit 1
MLDRQYLKDLAGYRNPQGLFISVCVSTSRLDDWRQKAPTFLNSEFGRLGREGAWNKEERRLLEAELAKIAEVLQYDITTQTEGVAVFADGTQGMFERVELPLRLNNRLLVEPSPYIRPLIHALEVLEPFLITRVSRDDSSLYVVDWWRVAREDDLTGPYLRSTDRETGEVPVKEYYAAARQENLVEQHFKEVALNVDRLLKETGVRRIVMCGQHEIITNVSKSLSAAASSRVSASISWDPATSVNQLVVSARAALADARRQEMSRLMERIDNDLGPQGMGVAGFGDVTGALLRGQVQTLLVERGVRPPGWSCVNDDFVRPEEVHVCPLCGGRSVRVDDMFGEAVRHAVLQGAEVEVVEGVERLHELGGIAGLLRFR